MNTLLVDAAFLFKKSFLGGKNIYSKGKSIGGLYTFFGTLRKLHTTYPINKIILCWDGENSGKGRYLIYKDYKANRESKSWHNKITLTEKQVYHEENSNESELWQRIRIKQYAEELFIRQLEVDEIEGDDLIAYYCLNKQETENVIIYTNDRDYSQLLYINNVSIKFDNIEQLINSDNFEFIFNYDYRNALTIKILTGDNSDNITGVSGLAENTLLKHFPELTNKRVMVNDIIHKAFLINEERVKNKMTRLKVLDKIVESKKIFIRNKKIMDLSHPFINTQVKEDYKQLYYPLDPKDRGSKNLIKMMNDDGFLDHYYGNSFNDYVKPFYSSITEEIKMYEKNNGVRRKKNINSLI